MQLYRDRDDSALAMESLDLHWEPHTRHQGAAVLIRQAEALDVLNTLSVADSLPAQKIPARTAWGVSSPVRKIEYGERFDRYLNAPLHRVEGDHDFTLTADNHADMIARELKLLIEEVCNTPAPRVLQV